MSDVDPKLARPTSTKGVTAFEPLGKRSGITVSIVMVPPRGTPKAWGHTESGACVEFTNARDAMLSLYHRLRMAGRESPPSAVIVDPEDFQNIQEIPRTECPIHVLPEIAPGSAIAFAPY